MICINKLSTPLTAALMAFTLCACSALGKEPVPPEMDMTGRTCNIIYEGKSSQASITNALGTTSISFTKPDSLEGIIYTFDQNGSSVTFGDLSFSNDSGLLSDRALPQLLHDILSDAARENALTSDSCSFSGKLHGDNYSIVCREDGKITEISYKGLRVTFEE